MGLWVERLFLFSSLLVFIALVFSTFWCARAAIGSAYEHLPGAKTITDYWSELENWHRSYSKTKPIEKAEADFKDFLLRSMANCAQRNWKTNHYRSQELYRTKLSLIFALFFVAILALAYYINFWMFPLIVKQ